MKSFEACPCTQVGLKICKNVMILVYDIAYIIDYDDIMCIIFCIYPNWADEQDATMSYIYIVVSATF